MFVDDLLHRLIELGQRQGCCRHRRGCRRCSRRRCCYRPGRRRGRHRGRRYHLQVPELRPERQQNIMLKSIKGSRVKSNQI